MAELHLDLDILESNVQLVASQIASLGKSWRPHIKSHRQPGIAGILLKAGAIGVTAATVVEVETMVEAGVPSVLLAHLVVSDDAIDRLARCAEQAQVILCIDHFVHAERLSAGAQRNAVTFDVLVDVDVGMHRTGCRPRVDATQLWIASARLPGLRVIGLMGYEGHANRIEDAAERSRAVTSAMNTLEQTRDEIVRNGFSCEIVSAGSSCTFSVAGLHAVVTEVQVGGAIFAESMLAAGGDPQPLRQPLTVTAEVVSRPSLTQAVANCGRKALNADSHPPVVAGIRGVVVEAIAAEHTTLILSGDGRDLQIGDEIRFVVENADRTIHLHKQIYVDREGHNVARWPVVR